MQRTVLFVDNLESSRTSVHQLLDAAGYRCLLAGSTEEASQVLSREVVHLVMTDWRLTNENDPRDHSGLLMIRETSARVPVVVFTAFPFHEITEEVFRLFVSAVDFLDKRDPPEKLLERIEVAFRDHVKVNFDAEIGFASRHLLEWLVRSFRDAPGHLNSIGLWTDHLEHIVRQLFYERLEDGRQQYRKVDLVMLQPGASGSQVVVARPVTVETWPDYGPEWVIKFDRVDRAREEYHRYFHLVRPFLTGITTTLSQPRTSGPLAGTAYTFAGGTARNVRTFPSYYADPKVSADDVVHLLGSLCKQTLGPWQGRITDTTRTLGELYDDLFGLSDLEKLTRIDERTSTYCFRSSTGFRIRELRDTRRIQVSRPSGQEHLLPNPLHAFREGQLVGRAAEQVAFMHGDLHVGNVVVDKTGTAWLIDFGRTSDSGPLFADLVELETSIRIDLLGEERLEPIFAFEECLARQRFSSQPPPLPPVLAENRDIAKSYAAVRALRQLVRDCFEVEDLRTYQIGLFFNAMNKLGLRALTDDPSLRKRQVIHSFLSAALIADGLENW